VLGRLLANSPQLMDLDLSDLPRLPSHVLRAALEAAGAAQQSATPGSGGDGGGCGAPLVRLRRLSLAGCERLQPPLELLAGCTQLVDLDVSGTAATDADVIMMSECLQLLRRLDVSGCIALTDAGVRGLAGAAAVRRGRLRALGAGRLPRVTGRGFAELLGSWARCAAVKWSWERHVCGDGRLGGCCSDGGCGSWGGGSSSSSSSCSSSTGGGGSCSSTSSNSDSGKVGASTSSPTMHGKRACGNRQCRRRRRYLLRLDVSGSGAVDGGVIRASVSAAAADAADAAAPMASPPTPAALTWREGESSSDEEEHGGTAGGWFLGGRRGGCDGDGGGGAAEEAAELLASLGLEPEESSSSSRHGDLEGRARSSSGGGGLEGSPHVRAMERRRVGRVQLGALLAAGCPLGACDLGALGAAGCLHRLAALDLRHCEPLRRPPPEAAVASAPAAARGGAGGGLRNRGADHPLAAALVASIEPRALRVLRLDGCHFTDAAAAALAEHCGGSLSELSLVGCRPLGDAGLRAFATRCTRLRALSVGGAGSHWREDAALAGAPALAALTSLRVARRALLSDAQLGAVLADCTRLRSLQLAGCYSLTDRAFAPQLPPPQLPQPPGHDGGSGGNHGSSSSSSGCAVHIGGSSAAICPAADDGAAYEVVPQRAPPLQQYTSITDVSLVAMDASFTGSGLARLPRLRSLRLSACPGVTPAAAQLVVACCSRLADLELPAHLAGVPLPLQAGARGAAGRLHVSVDGRGLGAGGAAPVPARRRGGGGGGGWG
jgi:hypothetical protein